MALGLHFNCAGLLCLQMLKQNIADRKPLVDRLNKTGLALLKLVGEENTGSLQDMIDDDNQRFAAIKNAGRERGNVLDEALQQSSEVISISVLISICNLMS